MGHLRRIGVLGGMGPEATIALMQRILAGTPAQDDADHVPLMVDMNPQVPSRIQHLIEETGPNPGPVMGDMAARLERAGAEALILPCNTAHHYADDITTRVAIPFLNMPQMTCAHVAEKVPVHAQVGILASPATQQIGLFETLLAAHQLTALWPADMAAVLATIKRIKSHGPSAEDVALLQAKTQELVDHGAAAIVVGCTEFSLISDQIHTVVPVIDALNVLVAATLDFAGVQTQPAIGA